MRTSRRIFLGSAIGASLGLALSAKARADTGYRLTDSQWRQRLAPNVYRVMRQAATKPPFSSPLLREHRAGTFRCAACMLPLFDAATKFESGTGWPSFWQALPAAVTTARDLSLGAVRTEVHCMRCSGHLGHVFDDGPPPTRKRFCMNGLALAFAARSA